MTKEEIFAVWAPPGGLWSPWVKPVLFAFMDQAPPPPLPPDLGATPDLIATPDLVATTDLSWVPAASENVALVLDLPGCEGVVMGLALAAQGYRPVPLYNACPSPTDEVVVTVVEVGPILAALSHGTEDLRALAIPANAPPVFLLDVIRRTGQTLPRPRAFDNRSISFPTDFPSANFLKAHSVQRGMLIQGGAFQPQPDLAHTLLRWQQAGIDLTSKRLDLPGPASPCTVGIPSRFRAPWYRFLEMIGYRRNALGGFGGTIPAPSSG